MIAIGTSLREARERRGLDFAQIEAETRIRADQLAALEAERFDKFPARVYARAFLREYSDFLGLDAEQFVQEFDARFPIAEEQPVVPIGLPPPWRLPRYTGAVALVLTFAAIAAVGWRVESGSSPRPTRSNAITTPRSHTPKPRPHKRSQAAPVLTLVAARGPCWLEAHAGSRAGRLLFRGMLEQGQQRRLPARLLWLRVGAPWNVEARIGGKHVDFGAHVANLLVTPTGARIE